MLTYNIAAGSTNVSVVIRIIDSTDGTPETAVEHNTTGIDLQYRREGAASTAITEVALAALTTAHTDGGIEHIGNGYYRLDLPDAAVASGVSGVLIHGTVTGMVVIGCYVHLDPIPVNAVEVNGTAQTAGDIMGSLGEENAAAAAGDPSTTESVMQYVKQAVNILAGSAGVATFPAEAAPGNAVSLAEVIRAIHADVTGLNGDAMRGTDSAYTGTPPTAAAIADQVWDEAKAGHVAAGSFGEEVQAHALSSEISALNDLSAADVNAQVDTALADIHLDHLLATDYDPASKPGVATALLNELVESDGGVSRLTANALEQSPTDVNVTQISGSAAAADNLERGALGLVLSAVNDASASTTAFVTDLTETTDDHYNGAVLVFTSGNLAGQRTDITDYNGTTKAVTVTALTEAPADNDEFVIS